MVQCTAISCFKTSTLHWTNYFKAPGLETNNCAKAELETNGGKLTTD